MINMIDLMDRIKDSTENVVLMINIIKLHVIYQKLQKIKYPILKGQDYWPKFFEKNLFSMSKLQDLKVKQDALILANYLYRIEYYP